ncbi:FMN-dependent NADH-azoreductase [Levilactobacillus spicheri]|jgi:Acyl carrier protein phosphodiesterase|uniref:FMN dependent NADH:quinone oxidoreductase n=2 Tax=Levilactobacillus spicheri TaxID=216463 RepID=A0A0F3RR93_9LACO|nr:NAD(P)H-dependent oxidoreductase [Levilactobacillus spicheri]KJW12553.1 FMN-dependent NADH-azoreductase [Levilactobacillus spicheri]KRL48633.1 FMN-dependent NADH-azoreductase 2 [Levilactobacillus spicheri DSM 15429]GEO66986.1 FMN-dependent NADH-azoreductase 2 [Levilactobacillus spicheri]
MTKVLVIYAHPETKTYSTTDKFYQQFIGAYREEHPEDEIIEHNVSEYMPFPLNKIAVSIYNKALVNQELNPDEARFQDARQKWVDEFIDADKYVFVNPMYNLFIPSEMKSYLDMIMQIPDTFHYTKEGTMAGMLHDKKAIHLQTAGGDYHGSTGAPDMSQLDLGHQYIGAILHVMGVDDFTGVYAEGMDHDPANAPEIMADAFQRAEDAARAF